MAPPVAPAANPQAAALQDEIASLRRQIGHARYELYRSQMLIARIGHYHNHLVVYQEMDYEHPLAQQARLHMKGLTEQRKHWTELEDSLSQQLHLCLLQLMVSDD